MAHPSNDRPYVQAWLKRVGRQLSGSGRVSQVAMALSMRQGGEREEWSRRLRDILCGKTKPGAQLIADIDQILAKPSPPSSPVDGQDRLF